MANRPWLVPAAVILLGLTWGSSLPWTATGEAMDLAALAVIGIVVVGLRYDQVVSLVTRRASRP